jgi:hypothetical protein
VILRNAQGAVKKNQQRRNFFIGTDEKKVGLGQSVRIVKGSTRTSGVKNTQRNVRHRWHLFTSTEKNGGKKTPFID